jgi:hypothetical protein
MQLFLRQLFNSVNWAHVDCVDIELQFPFDVDNKKVLYPDVRS